MITLVTAFINAKYRCDFGFLFIGTVLIDLSILEILSKYILK